MPKYFFSKKVTRFLEKQHLPDRDILLSNGLSAKLTQKNLPDRRCFAFTTPPLGRKINLVTTDQFYT
jgi:hypothetical protein